ncbi:MULTISPECIES: nitroreductase family protein [Methanobacterium]|jgi:nitroreductase|uniref:Nitroreductase n=1 Tax=Methanobacterium bryantii TaxID=2161 RepID=A0A2A2H6N3_METBR|nr:MULTISPECIES: nitroreductase family protein [Methanobacterium]OEC85800.1 nitroreductase [Methanobacterium sp. A39]PAV05047.1 nitroreductase [Methanobacterium bryantii]
MDLYETIRNRRSIRKYKDREIDDDLIHEIIEAGIWAPSAGNLQSWEVVVVKDPEIKSQLAVACYIREFIAEAPVVLVICAHKRKSSAAYGERGQELYCIQDAACAAQNMLLMIHDLGLGACWNGSFNEESVSALLGIPNGVRPVTIITVGYPDEKPIPPPREDIEDFIHRETY